MHRGAFCQFPFRWIYFYGSNKFTGKETGKMHLCTMFEKYFSRYFCVDLCFFILFFNIVFYLFFRLSLYRSLARKDIRTRNSISAYPQIKKMAHKRALNVWNHENQGKFLTKDFSFFLWKDFVLNRQKLTKKRKTEKDAHEPKKWTWKQMPNCLTKKKREESYTGNEWKKSGKIIHVKWWWVKKCAKKSVS